jgi:predicted PhzF superfamily epimerase YddE/YHI9
MRTPIFQIDAFASRRFAGNPAAAPYWAKKLGKTEFRAFQASQSGGEIICRLLGDRVELEGCCVFYMEGAAEI